MVDDIDEKVKKNVRKDMVRISRRWRACKAADPAISPFLFIAKIARTGKLPTVLGGQSLRFA